MSPTRERTLTGSVDLPYATVQIDLLTGPSIDAGSSAADVVLASWTLLTDKAGAWSIGLPVNEYVTPRGSRYRVTEVGSSTVVRRCVITKGSSPLVLASIAGTVPAPTHPGLTLSEDGDVVLGTTNGTKIGTSASQ